MPQVSGGATRDPALEAAENDLFDALDERLDTTDRDVLDSYFCGARSQREVAARLGISRYAVNRSTDNIKQTVFSLQPACADCKSGVCGRIAPSSRPLPFPGKEPHLWGAAPQGVCVFKSGSSPAMQIRSEMKRTRTFQGLTSTITVS